MTNFEELNLKPETLSAIEEMGFSAPTEIQAKAIPAIMAGKDLIAQAGTGSGKTLAFAVPTIEKLDINNPELQALVLCPTRELCVQVSEQFKLLMGKGLSVVSVYGGQNINVQLKALKKNPQVVVATPGRTMDHLRRKTISVDKIQVLVLDEADQMLDMGFREDLEIILKDAPKDRQTVMFSATVDKDILKLMNNLQNSAEHIDVTNKVQQSSQINQVYFRLNSSKSKFESFKRLTKFHNINSALIFCNTKAKVDDFTELLTSKGYKAAGLHGDMRQRERDTAMGAFRKEKIHFLVATDVAARGIDVDDVEAVFNYDVPRYSQDYLHRIGRTGRAGKEGIAFSFVIGDEIRQINHISKKFNLKINPGTIPEVESLESSGVEALKRKVKVNLKTTKAMDKYLEYLKEFEFKNYSPEEVSAMLLKLLLKHENSTFNESIDFTVKDTAPAEKRKRNRPQQRSSKGGKRSSKFIEKGNSKAGRGFSKFTKPRKSRSKRP